MTHVNIPLYQKQRIVLVVERNTEQESMGEKQVNGDWLVVTGYRFQTNQVMILKQTTMIKLFYSNIM